MNMVEGGEYTVELLVESGEWDATEFAHSHADKLREMGYEPVYFERTGQVALLREVED